MTHMDLAAFLRFAKRYNDMGWSIQGQLNAVAQGESLSDQNTNALEIISKFLLHIGEDVTGATDLANEIDCFLMEGE